MKRKVLLGLVMVLALSLSACGANEGSGSEGKDSATKTESSTSGDKKDADADKENTKDSKKKEVSLESLESLDVSPAEEFELEPDGKNPSGWTVSGYNGKDEMVVIPEEVNGKKVISITSKAFGEGTGVKAVKIPDSVERVGKQAFVGNEDLLYVIFGSNIKEIGDCAFQGCKALKKVELNEGLEKLGANAFAVVDSLTYIYIPESVTTIEITAIGTANKANCVIAGKAGSRAEEYAKERSFTFEAVE